jgi:hypothetical protein
MEAMPAVILLPQLSQRLQQRQDKHCILHSLPRRSHMELGLAIMPAISTTGHSLLHNQSTSGEDTYSGGSEQQCESETVPILLENKVARILLQLGQKP